MPDREQQGSNLVDTHYHLDLHEDPSENVPLIAAQEVYTIAVTTAPSFFEATHSLVSGEKFIRAALGFHPELVNERQHELDLFLRLLPQTRYVGEVGLDYYHSSTEERRVQRHVLRRVLDACHEVGNKILTVHSRRAAADVLEELEGFQGQVILHWFSGKTSLIQRGLEMGCYFSINPAMLRSNHGLTLTAAVPESHVLTESDGPFISVDGQPAKPTDVDIVIQGLASLWDCRPLEARSRVFENFQRLLRPK